MTKYFVYKLIVDDVVKRHYSRIQLKETKKCTLVGEGIFSDEFFNDSCDEMYSEFNNLEDIRLTYQAKLKDGETREFSFDLDTLLRKAKDGLLPYISFAEHKVSPNPKITILGRKINKPN